MFRTHIFFIALVGAPVPHAVAQTAGDGICVIQSVDGAARVFAPGAGRHVAQVGLGLGRNATLRTDAQARVAMQCDGDLRVVVGPDSRIEVAGLLDGQQTFGMRLMRGISGFIFDGKDSGAGIQVRTPSAVAAVRSTEWAMQVTDGASAVFSRESAVFVFGEDGSVQLGAGDGVDATARGDLGPVVQWGQARIDLFADLLGPDW